MVTVAPASAPDPEEDVPRPSLQELVASVAELLMGMGGDPAAATALLRELVGYFGVTLGYLRRNDHVRRCSILIEEYPPRVDVKDPDPLGEVYFETADPVFAQTEHFTSPIITSETDVEYQERVRNGAGDEFVPEFVSSICVPLLRGDVTIGILGFTVVGEKAWLPAEVEALQGLASLLTMKTLIEDI